MTRIAIVMVMLFGMHQPPVHVPQSIPCDFVIFTDQFTPEILAAAHKMSAYVFDASVYHQGIHYGRDFLGEGLGDHPPVNNFKNTSHPLVKYLFLKQNLHRLPELSAYEQVIWVEPTMHITDELFAEQCLMLAEDGLVAAAMHPVYRTIHDQAQACISSRFTDAEYMGVTQPVQDVERQYREYNLPPNTAVFQTAGAIVYPRFKEASALLDTWWEQTMKYTTNEELGFVYSITKHKTPIVPLVDITEMVQFVAPRKC